LHLEILVDRLRREFSVGASVGKPQVAYKESIRNAAKAEGKFIKQTGGHGQYGHVVLTVEPNEKGDAFVFENKIVGGSIPKQFVPAIEGGIKDAMSCGVMAGYPMIGIKATLLDGSYHEVDSSEMAFRMAASMAFRNAVSKAEPILLEPIMDIEIVLPQEYMGDVMADLNSRRGRIGGMFQRADAQVIAARVPLSEMFGYATTLRSLTQGRAIYTMQFSRYEELPEDIAQEFIGRFHGKAMKN